MRRLRKLALASAAAISAHPSWSQSNMMPCSMYDQRDMRLACIEANENIRKANEAQRFEAQQAEQRIMQERLRRQAVAQAEVGAERARLEVEAQDNKRAAQLERLPQTHIDRIHQYRSEIGRVQGIIDRERRIGRTSGYVNKQTMYQAGEFIEMYHDKIVSEYRAYRAAGGRKPLSAL